MYNSYQSFLPKFFNHKYNSERQVLQPYTGITTENLGIHIGFFSNIQFLYFMLFYIKKLILKNKEWGYFLITLLAIL